MAKRRRLLWQLYPTYLLITIISLAAATWFASKSLREFFLDHSASNLEARAHLIKQQVTDYIHPLDEQGIDAFCKSTGKHATTRITVLLPSGKVVGDSQESPLIMDNHLDRSEVAQALKEGVGVSTRFSLTLQKNMMYVGIRLNNDRDTLGILRVSLPLTSIDEAIRGIQIKIIIGGLFIALFAAFLSLIVSRRISRPIEDIKKAAEGIAHGDFQYRFPVSNTIEIGALWESISQMGSELHDRIDTIMKQRNEIEGVLSSMAEGVIAIDLDERLLSINRAAVEILDCDSDRVKGKSIQEVVRNSAFHAFVTETLSNDTPVERDLTLYGTGEKIVSSYGSALRDAEGKEMGALIVLNDITHLRNLENIRRDFAANVSHEIRTPITAIKGFVETLRDGAVQNQDDARRFLGIIGKHVVRLEAIIEDLLSLSRIEQDDERKEIVPGESEVIPTLRAAVQICESRTREKSIKIDVICPEDLKAKIDPPLIEQAVVNLLDNAIKYSDPNGSVNIEAKQLNGEIAIKVADHGCGIEKEHLPRLFERFYRVDKARSRQLGGTGLGLAIVKHIVQAHGGRVEVESTPGKGSVFSICLPKA